MTLKFLPLATGNLGKLCSAFCKIWKDLIEPIWAQFEVQRFKYITMGGSKTPETMIFSRFFDPIFLNWVLPASRYGYEMGGCFGVKSLSRSLLPEGPIVQ